MLNVQVERAPCPPQPSRHSCSSKSGQSSRASSLEAGEWHRRHRCAGCERIASAMPRGAKWGVESPEMGWLGVTSYSVLQVAAWPAFALFLPRFSPDSSSSSAAGVMPSMRAACAIVAAPAPCVESFHFHPLSTAVHSPSTFTNTAAVTGLPRCCSISARPPSPAPTLRVTW